MNVSELQNISMIKTVRASEEVLTEEIEVIAVSELMSDILTMDHDNMLLITALCTDQALRTADIMGAVAVIISKDKQITDSMITIAEECDIALFSTELRNFELCSQLIMNNLTPKRSAQ